MVQGAENPGVEDGEPTDRAAHAAEDIAESLQQVGPDSDARHAIVDALAHELAPQGVRVVDARSSIVSAVVGARRRGRSNVEALADYIREEKNRRRRRTS